MNQFYERFLVKSHLLYWVVIIAWILIFVVISTAIPIDVLETLEGNYISEGIILNEIYEYNEDYLYVYKSKSDIVERCNVSDIEYIDGQYTKINITGISDYVAYEGNVKIDLIVGKTNLLRIILGIDQKYAEKRYV